jgi:hypothetical protein
LLKLLAATCTAYLLWLKSAWAQSLADGETPPDGIGASSS